MNEPQTIYAWLESLGATRGLAEFRLDERGMATGLYRNTVEFSLEVPLGQDTAYLHATLLPAFRLSEAILSHALERNCFGLGTAQAWLARRKERGDLCVCAVLSISTATAQNLGNWLGNALELALRLTGEFHAFTFAATASAASTAASSARATPDTRPELDPSRFA